MNLAQKITLAIAVVLIITSFFVRIPEQVTWPLLYCVFVMNAVSAWRRGESSGGEVLGGLLLVTGMAVWFWLRTHDATWEAKPSWMFLIFVLPGLLLFLASTDWRGGERRNERPK